jgi:hypothetical protein
MMAELKTFSNSNFEKINLYKRWIIVLVSWSESWLLHVILRERLAVANCLKRRDVPIR